MCKVIKENEIELSRKTRGVYVIEIESRKGLKIGALGPYSQKLRNLTTRIREIRKSQSEEIDVRAFLDLGDNQALVCATEALAHLTLADRRIEGARREQFDVSIDEAIEAIESAYRSAKRHIKR